MFVRSDGKKLSQAVLLRSILSRHSTRRFLRVAQTIKFNANEMYMQRKSFYLVYSNLCFFLPNLSLFGVIFKGYVVFVSILYGLVGKNINFQCIPSAKCLPSTTQQTHSGMKASEYDEPKE